MISRVATLLAACACLAACGGVDLAPGAPATTPTSAPASTAAPSSPSSSQAFPQRGTDVSVPPAGAPPQTGHPWFLAIGDSITSGYTVDASRAGTNSAWPLDLQALLAKRGETWSLYDVACAGETLESYATRCHDRAVATAVLQGRPQRQAALDTIAAHRADLRLIAIDLGSNDLLRALESGATVQSVTDSVRTRLGAIVAELQAAAPGVPVIIANYYNPLENLIGSSESELAQVNAAVAGVAAARGAHLADFHAAFNVDPPPAPRLCVYVDCAHLDVHPTVAGHERLAEAALAAVP